MKKTTRRVDDDAILRGLTAIARDGLDNELTPKALYNLIYAGDLKIAKVCGRYTTTRARVRRLFDELMDGKVAQ